MGILVLGGCGSGASTQADSAPAQPTGSSAVTSKPASTPPTDTATAGPSTATETKASDTAPVTAEQVAKLVADRKPGSKIVKLTEDNDPNHLLGRPNGFKEGANIAWLECNEVSVDCGASVEIWPSEAAARARAKYIQGVFKSAPALGSEYDYVQGAALLRFNGELKPSEVKKLNPFGGEPITAD